MLEPRERLIVALDIINKDDVALICGKIGDKATFYKVGLQLFLAEGRGVLDLLKSWGVKVFLDLKLHDIPDQVAKACREIVKMGVDMTTIHTMGGVDMMEIAAASVREAADKFGIRPPILLGVTILTSLNRMRAGEIGLKGPISEQVVTLAALAKRSGLDGVVASPLEVKSIRKAMGEDFIIVTPGIRSSTEAVQDQKRVMSTSDAIKAGSSYLVVGRPILEAANPARAAVEIVTEIKSALP
ncbi:MAG: orotidine-5'-phosphate decarboxylase [Actinobacteria bacterium]|nr:orotidine-5'-phosphate decarboxylase [Actinomycetota bacterium]